MENALVNGKWFLDPKFGSEHARLGDKRNWMNLAVVDEKSRTR